MPMWLTPKSSKARSCSGRIRDGPQPNRPSRGLIESGITMSDMASSLVLQVNDQV